MTQPLDIIKSALQDLGIVAGEESINADDAAMALTRLNRFVAWLNTQRLAVPYLAEVIVALQANVSAYSVGPSGSAGATFVGSISGFVLTITSISAGAAALGQVLSGSGITAGTRIIGYGTGEGDVLLAPGTYQVNISQTVASTTISAKYERPLQARTAFVRAQGFDFPLSILSAAQFAGLPSKTLSNNVWPVCLYLEASFPNATIMVNPVPAGATEMHVFCDVQLQRFTSLNETIVLPDQYEALLEYGLAQLLLMPYGISGDRAGQINAALGQALDAVKTMNRPVQQPSQVDPILARRPTNGAAFILTGGY
jgi:hypothetical protein